VNERERDARDALGRSSPTVVNLAQTISRLSLSFPRKERLEFQDSHCEMRGKECRCFESSYARGR
jgi:hypothetical protein